MSFYSKAKTFSCLFFIRSERRYLKKWGLAEIFKVESFINQNIKLKDNCSNMAHSKASMTFTDTVPSK